MQLYSASSPKPIDLGYTDMDPAYGLLKNKLNLIEPDPFNLNDSDASGGSPGDMLQKPGYSELPI